MNLIDFLATNEGEVREIDICLYLYNNLILHESLMRLSKSGVKVKVYSIPLEGYDNSNPKMIYDYEQKRNVYNEPKSKYDLAEDLYHQDQGQISNFEIRLFPHLYIRSERVNPFSRGNMPYSLHCKSLKMEMKDGRCIIGLTSSNLAVRDLPKYEIMVVGQGTEEEALSARDFFEGLYSNSIPKTRFDNTKEQFMYNISMRTQPPKSRNMYISPFYNDSPDFFEYALQSIINKAKYRILICAQHISSYEYSYKASYKTGVNNDAIVYKPGFLADVLQKAKEGIHVQCISQTFVDATGNERGCRSPQNGSSFMKFIAAYPKSSNCHYSVNANTHSKFIIVDNTALVTTCNFTPTQFIYLPHVNIDRFIRIPGQKYHGIHSEVGQFIVIQNKEFCDLLVSHFSDILKAPDTYHYC